MWMLPCSLLALQVQTLIQNGPSWIIFIVGNYLPSSSSYFLVRRQHRSCTVFTSSHPPLRAPAPLLVSSLVLHSPLCLLTLNAHQHMRLHLHPRTLASTHRCLQAACGAVASVVWCRRTTSCSVRWCRCRCAWCSPTPPSASSSSGL